MSQLSLLIELQTVHDHLRVILRDLTAFPPDLAALDNELKTLARKLEENAKALADAVQKAKPTGAKGTYVQKVSISSTMGPGVRVDVSSIA